uniref:Mating-type P-specific polypeptide Pc n=1 Tax=Schizosaccharomyces pombe TaxID=4896 RepID=MATPC_SCHPM|nr:RecName: Full=Mating-type P-specific polypeptide Pc [Schizosaccharomyces pombe]CAA30482.1 unnamed protein product [Schizosaccharomyces pombe]CBB12354.1 P-specific polypeptide Pc [Schizosaccharomyces pombe]
MDPRLRAPIFLPILTPETLQKKKQIKGNKTTIYKNGFMLFRSRLHKILNLSGDWAGASAKCSIIWHTLPQNVRLAWSQLAELSHYQDVRRQIAKLERILYSKRLNGHNNYKLHISRVQ